MQNQLKITCRRAVLAVLVSSTISAFPAAGQSINEDYKLTAFDASADDRFGGAVAITDEIAVVGARLDDEAANDAGAAYLFNPTTGQQLRKLIAPDGAPNDFFGGSVAISGEIAIVGAYFDDNARGSAYLFDITSGNMLTKLVSTDRAQEDLFGNSVSISGESVVVGAQFDDDGGVNSGSAYLFNTSGQQLFKLTASDATAGASFGFSVGISGTKAIIGAPSDTDGGVQTGSAYLYDTTTGQQLFKLTAPFGASGDLFGFSVAISGNIAIVGASDDRGVGPVSGSAHLFDVTTGQHLFRLTADDAAATDLFGGSVGISSTRAIVGALGDDDAGAVSGSAYLFITGESCLADLNNDGVLDFFDISAFLTAFGQQDPVADFSGDGSFDFFDVSAFLQAFSTGCP